MGKRKIIIPFNVGSFRIKNIEDLKHLLKTNPTELIVPLKDGRLKRFLEGISERYIRYLDTENPEISIKNLVAAFGLEINHGLNLLPANSVITSVDDFINAIENRNKEIILGKGIFKINNLLRIRSGIKIKGQGKNETLLQIEKLLSPYSIELQDLTCEIGEFISTKEITGIDYDLSCNKKIQSLATTDEELERLLQEKADTVWLTEGSFKIKKASIYSNLIEEGKDKTKIEIETALIGKSIFFKSLKLESKLLIQIEEIDTDDAEIVYEKMINGLPGSVNWEFWFGSSFEEIKITENGTIYLAANGCLYSIDSNSGSVNWKFEFGGSQNSEFKNFYMLENTTLLIALSNRLYAVYGDIL